MLMTTAFSPGTHRHTHDTAASTDSQQNVTGGAGPESHCRCAPEPSNFELYQVSPASCRPSVSSFLCPLLYSRPGPGMPAAAPLLPLLSSFCSHYSTENAPRTPMTSSLPNGHRCVLTFLDHSLGAPVFSNPFLPGNCPPGFLWSPLLLSVLLPLVTPELTLSFLP